MSFLLSSGLSEILFGWCMLDALSNICLQDILIGASLFDPSGVLLVGLYSLTNVHLGDRSVFLFAVCSFVVGWYNSSLLVSSSSMLVLMSSHCWSGGSFQSSLYGRVPGSFYTLQHQTLRQ